MSASIVIEPQFARRNKARCEPGLFDFHRSIVQAVLDKRGALDLAQTFIGKRLIEVGQKSTPRTVASDPGTQARYVILAERFDLPGRDAAHEQTGACAGGGSKRKPRHGPRSALDCRIVKSVRHGSAPVFWGHPLPGYRCRQKQRAGSPWEERGKRDGSACAQRNTDQRGRRQAELVHQSFDQTRCVFGALVVSQRRFAVARARGNDQFVPRQIEYVVKGLVASVGLATMKVKDGRTLADAAEFNGTQIGRNDRNLRCKTQNDSPDAPTRGGSVSFFLFQGNPSCRSAARYLATPRACIAPKHGRSASKPAYDHPGSHASESLRR